MSVSVLNTTASLSGKTLAKLEDSQTFTGQKTFDVGASAPFVVVVGAAKVTNLDSDKLDGQEGAYYTNASNLDAGTVPDARFPATLPAVNGSALTNLNASNVASGTLSNARLNAIVPPTVSVLTDGATPALNAALGNVFTLAAAGDRTIAVPSNPTDGQKIIIRHLASGGARTLALNTGAGGFRFGTDITALTQTTSGKTDYIGCVYNATDTKWDVVAYVKGF